MCAIDSLSESNQYWATNSCRARCDVPVFSDFDTRASEKWGQVSGGLGSSSVTLLFSIFRSLACPLVFSLTVSIKEATGRKKTDFFFLCFLLASTNSDSYRCTCVQKIEEGQ